MFPSLFFYFFVVQVSELFCEKSCSQTVLLIFQAKNMMMCNVSFSMAVLGLVALLGKASQQNSSTASLLLHKIKILGGGKKKMLLYFAEKCRISLCGRIT